MAGFIIDFVAELIELLAELCIGNFIKSGNEKKGGI